jgi:hypothetical protein
MCTPDEDDSPGALLCGTSLSNCPGLCLLSPVAMSSPILSSTQDLVGVMFRWILLEFFAWVFAGFSGRRPVAQTKFWRLAGG